MAVYTEAGGSHGKMQNAAGSVVASRGIEPHTGKGSYGMKVEKNVPLEERAYAALKAMIINGSLEPGQSVPESVLAAQLGISRSPVKVALIRLIQDGFVIGQAWRVPQVVDFDAKYINDVYQLRRALDSQRAVQAIKHIPDAEIKAFAAQLAHIEGNFTPEGEAQIREAYQSFQSMLMRNCDNDLLRLMMAKLDDHLERVRYAFRTTDQKEFLQIEYWILKEELEALRNRDGERLAKLLNDHHDTYRRWMVTKWVAMHGDGSAVADDVVPAEHASEADKPA